MKAATIALVPSILAISACSNWYRTGHSTIAGLYTTTDVAWTYARARLKTNELVEVERCNDAGTPREQCDAWQDIAILRRNIATAISALDSVMVEAYEALEAAKEKPDLVSRAAELVKRAVAAGMRVRKLMRERNIWRDERLRELPEVKQ